MCGLGVPVGCKSGHKKPLMCGPGVPVGTTYTNYTRIYTNYIGASGLVFVFLHQNGQVGGKSAIFWLGKQTDHGALSWGFTPQLMAISLNGKKDDTASQILGYHVLGYSQIPSLHRNFSL